MLVTDNGEPTVHRTKAADAIGRRVVFLLSLGIGGGAFRGSVAVADEREPWLRGRIVEAVSMKPLNGASLFVVQSGGSKQAEAIAQASCVVTNPEGLFEIAERPAGPYVLYALVDDWEGAVAAARVSGLGGSSPVLIQIPPLRLIRGTVVRASDFVPIAGASVSLVGSDVREFSDVRGRFEFTTRRASSVRIAVSHPDFVSATRAIGPLDQDVVAELSPAGQLEGHVTIGGETPKNLEVFLGSLNLRAADTADFFFDNLDPGWHELFVRGEDGHRSFELRTPVCVRSGVMTKKDVELKTGSTVKGRIHFAGAPWADEGVLVRCGRGMFAYSISSGTADDGSFEIKNVPPGPAELAVGHEGFVYSRGVTIPASSPLDLDIELPTDTINGCVVDERTGRPARGAYIETDLEALGAIRIMVDANGRFSIPTHPKRAVTLVAQKGGYLTWQGDVVPTTNEPPLRIALRRAADDSTIVGIVVSSDGSPVPLSRIRFEDADQGCLRSPSQSGETYTDQEGRFVLGKVSEGPHLLDATIPGVGRGLRRCVASADVSAPCEITITDVCVVRVHATRSSVPVVGAEIALFDASAMLDFASETGSENTESDGVAFFDSIPQGQSRIEVKFGGQLVNRLVTLQAGSNIVDVDLDCEP